MSDVFTPGEPRTNHVHMDNSSHMGQQEYYNKNDEIETEMSIIWLILTVFPIKQLTLRYAAMDYTTGIYRLCKLI